ncbi:MAG: lysylphosphatidylglycerol synthase transmembrane domain-containing protein [Oscillospiraceae bacterium]
MSDFNIKPDSAFPPANTESEAPPKAAEEATAKPSETCAAPAAQASEAGAAPAPKSKVKKYIFSGIFLIALISVTFYVIFKDNSMSEIMEILKKVSLPYVFAGIVSMLGFIFFQGIIIGMAAKYIKTKIGFRAMMDYSFVGFFYSGITPSATGGQPMQFIYMCRDKISASNTSLVMFITNISYQLAIVCLSIFMLLYRLKFILSVSPAIIGFCIFGISVTLIVILVLVGILFSETFLMKMLTGIIKFLHKIKIIKKPEKIFAGIEKYIAEVKAGAALIKQNPKHFVYIMLVTLLQLLCYHLVPYFVYRAFGLDAISCMNIVSISAVLYIAVSFLPLPGTVGAAESGFLTLFTPVFAGAILPGMLLSRFINFYVMLVLSGIVSMYVQVRKPVNL